MGLESLTTYLNVEEIPLGLLNKDGVYYQGEEVYCKNIIITYFKTQMYNAISEITQIQ